MSARVRTGLDRIAEGDREVLGALRGKKLGLVAHPASVDRHLRHARQVLEGAGLQIAALFGPEHGYGGEAQDMIAVRDGDARGAGVPVHSLYGASEAELSPTQAQLSGLDAMVVDLQDVGSRYYTFVWTAVLVMRAAASAGLRTIVLDRPNPLGGELVEGAPTMPGYGSFVGLCEVAVRHGMTLGELCELARARDDLPREALEVVRMQGYSRELSFEQTGLPWVLPSPNMPTLDTARVYPGGCLLEGTELSEGRGTTRPFEIWGAPFLDALRIAREVELEGAVLRPLSFSPTFHKFAGECCQGLQVHVTDSRAFRPYAAYLQLIAAARRASDGRFAWRTTPYEFVSDRPAIDLLTGGAEFRTLVDAGEGLGSFLEADARAAKVFAGERQRYLLY